MSLTEPDSDSRDDQPTASLMGTHMGDRCSQCGAELAPDQRYCVDCGHRRGRARFSLDRGAGATGATGASAGRLGEPALARAGAVPPARTANSTVALLASVAVLLIAVGVGVLIGHSNNSTPQKAQVIEVGGGSSASSGTAAGSTGAAATSPGSSSSSAAAATPKSAAAAVKAVQAKAPKTKAAQAAAQKAPPSKAAQKAAAAAASSTATLSGSKKKAKIAPPTAKLGSKCSAGTSGCQGGKLTGTYFP